MRGSNILKNEKRKSAWAHGQPPLLVHPWQKQHMEVHIAISKYVGTPLPRRGTNGRLVGRHITGLRKHFVVKPA
jgi:hypothetical protein